MVPRIVLLVGFFLLLEPLLVLAHELGHATIVLASGEDATVAIGGDEGERYVLGPLALVVRPAGLLSVVTYGLCHYEADFGRWQTVAFALAAPAVTVALLVATGYATLTTSGPVGELTEIAAIYLGIQAAMTLVPVQYPSFMGSYAGDKSDGRVALDVLFGWDTSPNDHLSAPTAAED